MLYLKSVKCIIFTPGERQLAKKMMYIESQQAGHYATTNITIPDQKSKKPRE